MADAATTSPPSVPKTVYFYGDNKSGGDAPVKSQYASIPFLLCSYSALSCTIISPIHLKIYSKAHHNQHEILAKPTLATCSLYFKDT